MALFSGGRYIRAKLRQAVPEFWPGLEAQESTVDEYLAFWTFEGNEDGKPIKAEFKRRFAEVEGVLTGGEKDDIVHEAVCIMQFMVGVVEEIATAVGGDGRFTQHEFAAGQHRNTVNGAGASGVELQVGDEPSMWWLLLKHCLPMGIAELIAGASKAVTMGMKPLCGRV